MRCSAVFVLFLVAACSTDDHPDADVDAALDADTDAAIPDGGTDAPMCLADPASVPTPVAGHCHAAFRTDAAVAPMGADGTGGFVVPDGRRISLSAGTRVELTSGFPMRSLIVPGTHFVVVTDGGLEDEHLIVVDLD